MKFTTDDFTHLVFRQGKQPVVQGWRNELLGAAHGVIGQHLAKGMNRPC
jgi:hypothetical protein